MDLGRLPELMDRLGVSGRESQSLPLWKRGFTIGGLESTATALFVPGWQISYKTDRGSFTVSGRSIPEAVEAALANRAAW
jgi:hypothetical protein